MLHFTIWLGIFCGLLLVGGFAFNGWKLAALERRLDGMRREAQAVQREEATKQDEARKVEDERIEAGHQALLRNPGYLSGTLARKKHEEEWALRLAHDLKAALTAAEKSLVRMERVGGDATVQAKVALEIVTVLAAPPGSRVEVLPLGDGFSCCNRGSP